jgi:hypothetical protein
MYQHGPSAKCRFALLISKALIRNIKLFMFKVIWILFGCCLRSAHPWCDPQLSYVGCKCLYAHYWFDHNQHIHDYTRQNVLTVSRGKLIGWHLTILEMQARYQLSHFFFRKAIVGAVAHSREMRLAQRVRARTINLHHWQVDDDRERTVTSLENSRLV